MRYLKINNLKTNDSSFFLHLNIASLNFHIYELKLLINSINKPIKVFGISESKLKQDDNLSKVDIEGYHIEHCCSEAKKGGTLLYINTNQAYKSRPDLYVYKPRELESTFRRTN